MNGVNHEKLAKGVVSNKNESNKIEASSTPTISSILFSPTKLQLRNEENRRLNKKINLDIENESLNITSNESFFGENEETHNNQENL